MGYLNNTCHIFISGVTFIGAYLIFWPMHYEGLGGFATPLP